MNCDQFQEAYELYALGLLETPERTRLADHLREGCPTCRSGVQRALEQNATVSSTVSLVNPSPRLRRRIVSSVGEKATPQTESLAWLWGVAALAAATILALTIGLSVQNRAWRAERNQARAASSQLAHLSDAVKIMQAPETEQIDFSATASGTPGGRLFVHRHLGVALVARGLSAAPAGWKYESWIVPKSGPPQPVEDFELDPAGQAITVVPGPVRQDDWKEIAVSQEPENGQLTRPTKLLLSAPLAARRD
ncbi:MAG TPA: anti-sigma factor [Bryobacteraceae bacterium]|nr:anti-sigma factor [Bryobacteraceae bacterium]